MDAIGNFQFLRLTGHPERAQLQLAIERRSGIDGVTIWETGEAGEPIRLQSFAFALDYASAKQLYRDYLTLIPAGPVQVSKGGAEPTQLYKVLKVIPVDIRAILRGMTGDGVNYQGLCVCDWILFPINPTVQPPS